MENHHFQWVNPLFLWPFSIAMLVITRGYPLQMNSCDITLLYRACAKPQTVRNRHRARTHHSWRMVMKKSVYRYPNDKLLVKQSRNHQNRWHGWSFTPRQYGKFQQISPNLWLSSPNGFLWKSKKSRKITMRSFGSWLIISHFVGKAIMIMMFAISHSYPMDRWGEQKATAAHVLGPDPYGFGWDDPWPCRVTLICIYPPIQEDSSLYGGVQFMRVPPNHPSKTMTYIDLLKAMVTWRSSHHDLRNMKSHENC